MDPLLLNRTALARKLRFSQLLVLEQVMQSRSILHAAQALNLTQPAVSKVVLELEAWFGEPLLVRSNRGVAPTEFGELIGRRAKTLLAELRAMTDELNAYKTGVLGHVIIGTLIAASSSLLPHAIARLKAQAPQVIVTLRVGQMDQLLPILATGDLDLVVGRIPDDQSWRASAQTVAAETLYRDELCVVAGRQHPQAKKKALGLHDLAGCPWILPTTDSSLRKTADRLFAQAGLPPPDNLVESMSVLTNLTLLSDFKTCAFMPRTIAMPFVESGMLSVLPVKGLDVFGDIGFFHRPSHSQGPAVELFKTCLREAVREVI
ncbi:LysR family transcriptional regulator [Paralcaligenes sp. KSB-10]|uniref:LysR family transcriptional regulator n=1 Tax=Paralcaligenes sp. KSB-10 TaxID=2901142 RepID=UPI001E4D0FE3|nr:LysR substrate-binding domain-containing protein [Paralcaligenes sp. KSB-10]UHL64155.1 LysR family transcriptional regulator [Paralcaligenes sp. KSB-10]